MTYKVLIPLDGSRLAEHSLSYLEALKDLGETTVRLLSVVDDSEEPQLRSPTDTDERELNLLATYQREISTDVEKHLGMKVETKVVQGAPAEELIKEAAEFEPDLLIISTHGRSGPSRWRFGSVTDKVIRAAGCDTMVVGPGSVEKEKWLEASLQPPFKSILVPLDGSQLALQALPKALDLAKAFGSTLHVMRVVPYPTMIYGFEGAYMTDMRTGMLESLEAVAHEHLSQVTKDILPSQNVITKVVIGAPEIELESYIRENNIDLVVMTSHGRGGLVRMALGSVTDRLLSVGAAPVLICSSQGDCVEVRPPTHLE